MQGEGRGGMLKQLQTVLTAGAIGSLPDGVLLERFLSGRGNADSSAAFAVLVDAPWADGSWSLPGRAAQPS